MNNFGLPELTEKGHLPEGVFSSNFVEVQRRFVTGIARQRLWTHLETFLLEHVSSKKFVFLYLGGDFLSIYPDTSRLDIILQTRAKFGPESFSVMKPFFLIGLDQILEHYGINLNFWADGFPGKIKDFKKSFQYVGGNDPNLFLRSHRQGILKLNLAEQSMESMNRLAASSFSSS